MTASQKRTAAHRAAARLLPDSTPLKNKILAGLPDETYRRVSLDLRMTRVTLGQPLMRHGDPLAKVYFPNGGVFSITNQMKDGSMVEIATVGREGMLGANVILGDLLSAGTSLQQVPNGLVPSMPVRRFLQHVAEPPLRELATRYLQAQLLQIMHSAACNALHHIEQRCCRWLLQTHDRVEGDEFQLKHEFLAIMLGTHRPTVTVVLGHLQKAGLVTTRYGRLTVLNRRGLEASACECYAAIRGDYARLGI